MEQLHGIFLDPNFKINPYPFFVHMRSEMPVQKTVLPNGVEVYLVTRYEDVQNGLKDARLVKNIGNVRANEMQPMMRMMNNATMLRADPPEHTRLRALAHAAFTPKFVSQLRGHIQEIADGLLDAVQPAGKMDLLDDFAFPLAITVICEMLGIPTADDDKFRQWSSAIIAAGVLNAEVPQVILELSLMLQYLNQLIDQRRSDPRDDLISSLIHVDQDGDRFSDVELLSTCMVLLIAGHETTANLIGNGMLSLLQDPDQLAKLKEDPALIKSAVEELLRFASPVQFVNRFAAEDIEIAGMTIPKGSHLLLSVAAANHDPAYVANPEQLDVEHGDPKHVSFGQGIHYCLGAPLARLEGEIAFTTLLKRLPNIRLGIAPDSLSWRSALELRGLSSLPVVF